MKILAISGGTKNGTNDSMAAEALMGAKEEGAETEFIRLHDLNLKPCIGCIACVTGKDGIIQGGSGDCVFKDDISWLDEKIKSADGTIWVMPIFEKGPPAILHIVQDKLCGPGHDVGFAKIAKTIAEKAGRPGPDERIFNPGFVSFISIGGTDWSSRAAAVMNTLAMSRMWKVIDNQVFQWAKSLVLDDERVKKIHHIGVNIAKAAADKDNAKYQSEGGVCPNCHSRNFWLREDGIAECEVCAIRGSIKFENNKYVFEFDQKEYEHAHNLLPGKMIHIDDVGKAEVLLAQQKETPEFKNRKEKYRAFIAPSKPEK
jgi:multimeric flavodoxin WrbA